MLTFKDFRNRLNQLDEGTEYHLGQSGFIKLLEKNPNFKPLVDALETVSSQLHLQVKDDTLSNVITFKVLTGKDFTKIESIFNKVIHIVSDVKVKHGVQIDFKYEGVKFVLYSSGGRLTNVFDEQGNKLKDSAPKTEQQEDAVTFALNQHSLPTEDEINKKIGFKFDSKWHHSFARTYNLITNQLGIGQYTFYRDSSKNKPAILNKMMTSKYLPDSKDNWNPSDVWAIHNGKEQEVTSRIQEVLSLFDKKQATIYDLNFELEKLFIEKLLIGISLKKIEKGAGSIKPVKVTEHYVSSVKFVNPISESKFKYDTTLSYIDLNCEFNVLNDPINYQFRIAPRASSGDLNLYIQGAIFPQKGKWDGSVSKILLNASTENKIADFKQTAEALEVGNTVQQGLAVLGDENFTNWVNKGSSVFLSSITGIDDELKDTYTIKRALCLLNFVYELEQLNIPDIFRKMFLSSTKMNDFSSIHFKVS
jgi:hypothetical protein